MKRKVVVTIGVIALFVSSLFFVQTSGAVSLPISISDELIEKIEPSQGALSIPIKRARKIEKESRSWCKDLCGDGICQEITCMAIGCPCPETPQTCPQDCKRNGFHKPIENPADIPNPAAVYCKELGYKYEIRKDKKGEYGVCVFPDGSECNAWDFYRGLCGQEYLKNKEESKKEEVLPVVTFPVKKVIKINPKKENPLFVEEKPIKFEGYQPDILFEVTTKEKSVSVRIHIDKQRKLTEIKVGDKVSICKETLKFEENKIKIQTPEKEIRIEVLPDRAFEIAKGYIPEIKRSELKVEKSTPLYEFEGQRKGKLLFFFPVKVKIVGQVDANTGKIIKIKKPWWSFLVF